MEIKEKIQKIISIFQNLQFYQKLIQEKLECFKKSYSITNLPLYERLIRLMSMCLIVDHFISILKPQNEEIKYINELRKKKDFLLIKIKQEKSILTIQGKMRQNSKLDNLQLLVIKITHSILSTTVQKSATQQQLFKRLNILVFGVNISSKCYKLSLNKVNRTKKMDEALKQSPSLQPKTTKVQKQKTQFNKIFFSCSEANQRMNKPVIRNKNIRQDGHQRIANIIQKVRNTIQIETKVLKSLHQFKTQKLQQEGQDQKQIIQGECTIKEKRMSQISISTKKKSNRSKKRVGTINQRQNMESRFKNFQDCIQSSHSMSGQSIQSIPQTNQNWYKAHNKVKVKRIYTLSLPGLTVTKQR